MQIFLIKHYAVIVKLDEMRQDRVLDISDAEELAI